MTSNICLAKPCLKRLNSHISINDQSQGSILLHGPSMLAVKAKIQASILLHGPSKLAVKAKNYGVIYNQASSIAFDETSSYWSALKSSSFLGFSLVTTR